MEQVAGSQTSVFAGVFTHDYHEALVRDEDRLPRFMLVGTWNPMSSNRISHFFDFRGASMTLETGCSTTLVALHQAVQSLRNREADMSVVTGVNLILGPDQFKAIGSLGMLSPDGKSYAFDKRANSYGRGEGVATILIKRLSDALAANDPIRAVIRETALNQDGKTETITTPSGSTQETLMRECYRRAGLDPRGTQYFEAHGTGTQAGDPIEARAMAGVFCGVDEDGTGDRDETHYLRIGSVKTNVGHTEAASGLAAVIKGALCLERGLIPPSVNYETPNPKLKLDEWRLKVVTAMEPWPESLTGGPKRLSVNNFGYGGSNAHVIMESAEPWTSTPTLSLPTNRSLNSNGHVNGNGYVNANGNGISNGHLNGNGHVNGTHKTASSKVLVLSARDERGCQRMVEDMKAYLEKHKSLNFEAAESLLRDLSYTLAERRTLFPWVAAHQVRLDTDSDRHPLDAVIEAFDSPRFKPGRTPTSQPRIGMVFTGQGAQWNAMGRGLLEEYPVFRQSIDEAEAHLHDLGASWSLLEELRRDPKTTRVHATSISIPVCVAVQIALVRLLKSWGIKPAAVTSHSSGEIAAAYAVGALTHRQAMATAYYRAVLAADESNRVSGGPKGGMAAVGLGADEAQEYLDRVADVGKVVIACVNSPQSVTVSGDNDAVAAVEALCKEEGVFARKLKVEQAYHSHHMDPLAYAYHELLRKEMVRTVTKTMEAETEEEIEEGELKVIFSSAVTGGRITDAKEIADPDHWVGSLVQPVLFVDAFTDMVLGDTEDASGGNIDVVLEVGPHTALGGPIREIMSLVEFDGIELPYWGALVRNEHAGDTMRTAAINLLREGLPLIMSEINLPKPSSSSRWHLYDDDLPRVLTDLPTYPWNHSMRHWQEARVNYAIRTRSQPPHDLLGMPVPGTDPDTAVWRRSVRVSEVPWVRDHMVQGSIVYPGSGYVCLAIEAANQLARAEGHQDNISGFRLRDVDFMAALVIPDSADGVEIRTTVRPVPKRELGLRGWRRFEVSTVTPENQWTLHARGLVTVELKSKGGDVEDGNENSGGLRPLSAYTRHKDPRDMFAHLRARGVYHGPLFQNTTKIVQDGREPRSITDVTIRYESAADTDPVAAAQESVLHPITLDAVVVSFFSTLPGVGVQVEDPRLPRSIESMWVSSRISRKDGHTLRCDTSLSHDDPQGGRADVIVVDGQTGVTVLEIQGLTCSSLGRGSGAMARQGANGTQANDWEQDVCSKVEWAADLSLQQPAALAQIKDELAGEAGVSTVVVSSLSRAVVYYAEETLKSVTADDMEQLKDQQPHLVEYYAWLSQLVTQADSQKWLLDSPEERQKHFAIAASQGVDGELISRVGPITESILLGESNSLVAMAKDGLLQSYYAHSMRLAPSLTRLSTLVRRVAHKNPAARVLQIGAGTGAAAPRSILKAIGTPKISVVASWHITEPSTDILEDTQAELADWADFLEFSVLDINRDPSKQGFTPESYDIVVCYQSLHTAEDVAGTLAHVRLKPGGKLLLAETTRDQSQIDLFFILGLLPTPASSHSISWDSVLQESGFSGADLAIDDATTTVLSTRPIVEQQKPDLGRASNPGGFAIVTSNKTPAPAGLVDLLSQRIHDLTKTTVSHLVLEESTPAAYESKVCVFVGDIDEPTLLTDLDATRIEGLRAMVTKCGGLVWITTGGAVESERPEQALAQGFLRVLRNEYVGRRYLYIDLDPRAENNTEDIVSTIVQVLQEGFGQVQDVLATEIGRTEFEYAQRNGVLLIPRVYKDEEYNDMVTGPLTATWGDLDAAASGIPLEPLFQQNRPLRLEVGIPGHLDTLAFVDDEGGDDTDESFGSETIEITPRAFGLSSRDAMAALGQLKDRSMGLECAGIITRVGDEARTKGGFNVGDRVMALLPGSGSASLRSNITVPWDGGIVKVPSSITNFEEAASVPLAFTIAYAGLVDAARLAPGQSVLVHAAAGAIGQAAIMLAKHLGVTDIYATARSPEKRELVGKKYGIPAQRIFSSRDVSFGPAVLAATGRRGVDVVLNTLPGILLQASLDALARLGHLVEVGKRDIEANGLLALAAFSRGISLTALDIPTLVQRRRADVRRVLSEVVKLIEPQAVMPIYPVTKYPLSEVQEAFKFVETGAHTGKVVLSAGPDEQAPVLPRPKHATGRLRLRPDASYLVVGGIGGIGRSIAHWLVAHGAKNLILLSRSAGNLDLPENKDTSGALFVRELRESAGCRVKLVSCDVSLASNLVKALRVCADDGLPPVRGVVQGAMLLRDAIFEQMTLADWHGGLRPKVDGTWNLHTEFAAPDTLDFFVMLSSVSGVLGIASQTNYAAGGSYEDAMANWRQSKGLPGVSIDLGPIADVGYVAETAKVAERMRKSRDYVMLDENTVLRAFEAAVARPLGGRRQIIVGLNAGPGPQWDAHGGSQLGRDARYVNLKPRAKVSRAVPEGTAGGKLSLASQLTEAGSRDEAARIIGTAIADKLASIFMIDVAEIDLGKKPAGYGVDSLIAVELRNMLVLQAGADVSIFNILQSTSLATLAADMAAKSSHVQAAA
ncbi:hypothetical protein THARTR1_07597 [Trichoderma harzianum]|uniref:Uncharacterized protein n=1 Tax=Trichoderma harzianum TaxID=5544 RepID=A0A2K0U233_TRIHA|nr:hypothetical protein THARTR1_07597 [Trichoderma harzianum]